MSEAEGHAKDAVVETLKDHRDTITLLTTAVEELRRRVLALELEVLPRAPEEES